jgi:flagellar protein FliS
MNSLRASQLYHHVGVETAEPLRLVILAYQGAVDALKIAREALGRQDYEVKGRKIQQAMDLISELLSALDKTRGGEIARNLATLYGYFLRRLLKANRDNDIEAINEVMQHLSGLQEAWEQIARQGGRPRYTPRADAVALGARP